MSAGYRRTGQVYLETRDDRLALKADDDALTDEQPSFAVSEREELPAEVLPEFQSIEAFVDDNDTGEFTPDELQKLCLVLRLSSQKVRKQLEDYGLKLRPRQKEREIRGCRANSHDLWMPAKKGPRIPETATSKATCKVMLKLAAVKAA